MERERKARQSTERKLGRRECACQEEEVAIVGRIDKSGRRHNWRRSGVWGAGRGSGGTRIPSVARAENGLCGGRQRERKSLQQGKIAMHRPKGGSSRGILSCGPIGAVFPETGVAQRLHEAFTGRRVTVSHIDNRSNCLSINSITISSFFSLISASIVVPYPDIAGV